MVLRIFRIRAPHPPFPFVFRAITIALFSPLLKKVGYGMTWRNGAVLTWGGLRGAVGLALALLVARDSEIDQISIGNKVYFAEVGRCSGGFFPLSRRITYSLKIITKTLFLVFEDF